MISYQIENINKKKLLRKIGFLHSCEKFTRGVQQQIWASPYRKKQTWRKPNLKYPKKLKERMNEEKWIESQRSVGHH